MGERREAGKREGMREMEGEIEEQKHGDEVNEYKTLYKHILLLTLILL